jgi:hypothetical protein
MESWGSESLHIRYIKSKEQIGLVSLGHYGWWHQKAD